MQLKIALLHRSSWKEEEPQNSALFSKLLSGVVGPDVERLIFPLELRGFKTDLR